MFNNCNTDCITSVVWQKLIQRKAGNGIFSLSNPMDAGGVGQWRMTTYKSRNLSLCVMQNLWRVYHNKFSTRLSKKSFKGFF
jgi:hypothetical protein